MDTMTVQQAAELLHLHVKRVQAMARSGRIPAVRVGRKWLFHRQELQRLLGRPQPALPAQGLESLSARNNLRGTIEAVRVDGVMAEVIIRIGDQSLVSIITRASAERLGLTPGDDVYAVIKSTEVMVAKPRVA
jgi:molybdopterin-binding protein